MFQVMIRLESRLPPVGYAESASIALADLLSTGNPSDQEPDSEKAEGIING